MRLFRERQVTIYIMVGHGEVNLASYRPHGFSSLAGLLRDEGWDVRALVGGPGRTSC